MYHTQLRKAIPILRPFRLSRPSRELSKRLNTDSDGVMAWANEQARLETMKYKSEKEDALVMVPFHSNKLMDYHRQKLFTGGYLFLQSIYYGLKMDSICRNIRSRYKFEYDLNAILSDLIYTRVLEPSSKSSSFRAAKQFLEPPTYELHDVYRALSVLVKEIDFIQSEVYKNSFFRAIEMTGFFITIVQTTILRLNRRTEIKNTAKVKNTGQTPLFRWAFLRTVTDCR